MRVPFLRLSFLLWIIVPLIGYGTYLVVGDPYFIWSYDWRDNGTYDPAAHRHYTRCTYVGWHGTITEYPTDGRCGWLRFGKSSGARL